MSHQPYMRPPITEAVIGIRFESALESGSLEKISSDFLLTYPQRQTLKNLGFKIEVPHALEKEPVTDVNQQVGYRLLSSDATAILVLWPADLAVSQLAPYPGWDDFFARFDRDWIRWKRVVGYRKLVRIGVRFINRLDIPAGSGRIREAEYLKVYPQLPEIIGPATAYGLQIQASVRDMGCKLVLNTGEVPSPLLDHVSIVFDQDLFREGDCPQRDDEIYELIGKMRIKKNEIFEACVTDRARELFQK